MTTIHWKTAANGDWSKASAWSTGKAPGASDDAVIDASGAAAYAVTISKAQSVQSLTINGANALVDDKSTLTLNGALTVTAGVFQLDSGGVLNGGTLSATGGSILFSGGTLSGVAYQGTMNIDFGGSVHVSGGLTLTGAGGTGSGTITIGSNSEMWVAGGETLDNATLNMGRVNSPWDSASFTLDDLGDTAPTLTFGAKFNVVQNGQYISLQSSNNNPDDTIINDGSISAAISGGYFYLNNVANLVNNGNISASNGDNLYLPGHVDNNGSISVGAGGVVHLGYSLETWSNAGLITVAKGGELDLSGQFTVSDLDNIASKGVVKLVSGGTLEGGVIGGEGAVLALNGGTLSGVTYQGTLDLSTDYASAVNITNGVTLTGAGGKGAATVNLTGAGSYMSIDGNQTLDNATVNIGNNTFWSTLALEDLEGAGAVLTLGKQLDIVQVGAKVRIEGSSYVGDSASETIINDGSITASFLGGQFQIGYSPSQDPHVPSFFNDGTIYVSNSDFMSLESENISNKGTIEVGAGGTLEIGAAGGAWTNAGSISADTGGELILNGQFTADQLTRIKSSGTVEFAGTIVGGVITNSDPALSMAGGTLSGVTYQGAIDLSAGDSALYVNNGLKVTGANGKGAGEITLTGDYSDLYVTGGETLDNITLDIGGAPEPYGQTQPLLMLDNPDDTAPVLTLGKQFHIVQVGESAGIGDVSLVENWDYADDEIIDDGSILANISGGIFNITGFNFINNGTISVSNRDQLDIQAENFSNNGTISVGAGSILQLGTKGSTWTNTGSIRVAKGGELDLGGQFTGDQLAEITSKGVVRLTPYGTIEGGVVGGADPALVLNGGTLSGVTWQGTMDLSTTSSVVVTNGLTMTGADGSGLGTIDLTGAGSSITALGDQTLDNATLKMGNGNPSTIWIYGNPSEAVVLTLGSHFSIVQSGQYAFIYPNYSSDHDTLVNNGSIIAGVSGGTFYTAMSKFINNGIINSSNGEIVDLSRTHLINNGSVIATDGGRINAVSGATLTGGIYEADSSSIIDLGGPITADAATAILNGAASTIEGYSAALGYEVAIDSSLTSVAATGALEILGGRNWTSTKTITNAGTLDLGGGTFKSAALDNTATGTIAGYGTIVAKLTNDGVLSVAAGQTLSLQGGSLTSFSGGTLSGGTYEVGAGGSLQLADNSVVTTLDATVDLAGVGAVLQSYNTATSSQASLEASLTAIGATGALEVLGGRNYSTSNALVSAGTIELGGGTLTSGSLTNTGTIAGYGAIVAPVTNNGLLSVTAGQTLSLEGGALTNLAGGALSGGVYAVGAGGTLQLADNSVVTTLNATVDLAGVGAMLQSYNTATSSQTSLETNLSAIGASGTLEVLGGRGWTSTRTLSNSGTITLGGGTFKNAALTNAATGTLTGYGVIAKTLTDKGAVVASGGALAFSGTGDTFAGALTGTEIDFAGGADLLQSGASLTAGAVKISGGAAVSLQTSITYAGTLTANTSTLNLGGKFLTLSGVSIFSGAAVDGPGYLYQRGTAAVTRLTLGGKMNLSNFGLVTQSGQVTVGDAAGPGATITNKAGATWNLTAAVGLSGGGVFANSGLLEKTSSGTSLIDAAITNSGTIAAAKGTLDLTGAVTGAGVMHILGGATLELDGKVGASQQVAFGAGVLKLTSTANFFAGVSGFGAGDKIDLANITHAAGETVGFVENAGGTQGVLTITSGSEKAKITLFGQYTAANFKTGADAGTGTTVTFVASAGSAQSLLTNPLH